MYMRKKAAGVPLGFIEPCLPSNAIRVPSGSQWVYEIKHDGYRMIVRKQDNRVRLFTRRGFDWTAKYPLVADAVRKLKVTSAVFDCELVICRDDGVTDFEKLHSQCFNNEAFLCAFDLLELDGTDLRTSPLEHRKLSLAKLLKKDRPGIQFNGHIEDMDGTKLYEAACKMGLEGIVAKRRDLGYRSGRCKTWIKIKNPRAPAAMRIMEGTF
jgi:bifunctional non-homologous end joining protein LigD